MAHYLQSVLDIDNSLLTAGLARLEKSTGNSGVDTRLIADILEKAHQLNATYIVVGTHGRTGLSHTVLGSTAEYIIQRYTPDRATFTCQRNNCKCNDG